MSYRDFKKRLRMREIRDEINIYENRPFDDMTKKELDDYALNETNIELDRRKSLPNMIKQFIAKLKGEK